MSRVERIASIVLAATDKWTYPSRQRELPFEQGKRNWTHRPPKLVKDYFDSDDSNYYPDYLYHVTTNLQAVLNTSLKSRHQLHEETGKVPPGLGGGSKNEAPNKVSLTYSFQRAREIYDNIMFVARIVSGQTKASEIYSWVLNFDTYRQWESSDVDELIGHIIGQPVTDDMEDAEIQASLDQILTTPEQVYDFFTECEQFVTKNELEMGDTSVLSMIGFTQSFDTVRHLDPAKIAILQVAVRQDAVLNDVPLEAELRVAPQDVKVIRWLQPR